MNTDFQPRYRAFAEHSAQIEAFVREHRIAHDKFTEQQMADLILQMLASGDIVRHVRASDGAQCVSYSPYSESERLRSRIQFLESLLESSKQYITGVNADWPKGQDDDRDELLEKIEQALPQKP